MFAPAMLPDLAVMIGAYICFRMLEVTTFNSSRYKSKREHIIMIILALIVLVITVAVLFDIVTRSSGVTFPTPS
jgi:hypothetical protein